MVKTEREYREDICQVGRLVFQKGWVAANDGNITIRLDAERILATPTGVCKGHDAARRSDHRRYEGQQDFRARRSAPARSPCTPRFTDCVRISKRWCTRILRWRPVLPRPGAQLNLALLPEVIIGLGCVPLADYGLPGTDALTEPMLPLIPKYDALMMANHGAVCYGEDVFKAYFKMETMEHFARIQLVAELLGGPKVLPRVEVDKLLDSRTRYGVKAKSAGEPNCPVAAEEVGRAACGISTASAASRAAAQQEEHFYVSRSELVQMVEEALKARGLA